jgi:ABC-type nitrate/sulfonate/bicarbonate transport system substrate-binding protein
MRRKPPGRKRAFGFMAVAVAVAMGCLMTACSSSSSGAAAVGSVSSGSAGSTPNPINLRVVLGGLVSIYMNVFVGQEEGIFAKNGVNVTTTTPQTGSSTDSLSILLSGAGDIEDALPDPAIAAAANGTDLKVLSLDAPSVYSIVLGKGITSYATLPAHFKVAVSSPTTSIAALTRQVLNSVGIASSRYDFVAAGGTAPRLAALEGGAAQLTLLSQPADFEAQQDGLTVIGHTTKQFPWYGVTQIVQASTLSNPTKCAGIQRYLKSLAEVGTFLKNPANKSKVIADLVKHIPGQANAEKAYDLYVQQNALMGVNNPTQTIVQTANILKAFGTKVPSNPASMVTSQCGGAGA